MNGPAAQLLTSAAVFRGELGRILLALGIVLLVMILAWAIEDLRAGAAGWLGLAALGFVAFGAASLIAVGLL